MVSLLLAMSGGVRGGMMIFYLLPLAERAAAATIAAFFVCSLAGSVLLIDSLLRGLQPGVQDPVVFQAGLYGAALFAITDCSACSLRAWHPGTTRDPPRP